MKKQTDRNGEVVSKGETRGSVRTRGLCQAFLMLGLLWAPVGLMVSESSPRATGCLSFRSSDCSYHDQASRGCTVQEQALNCTCAQCCRVQSASIALWDSYSLIEEQPEKHLTDFSVTEKMLHQADRYLFERKQLGKAAIVAPSYTYLFICE